MAAPKTFCPQITFSPDILSPPVGSSIATRRMGDRQDVMMQCMARGRRWRRSIAAGALFVAALELLSVPTEVAAQAHDVIEVQGNRRIAADTVRSYFHAAPDG